jgi:2-polyprenyl-3-methyl-5-hydroxy-6-metoxy-1,4-benzoquinol methylase
MKHKTIIEKELGITGDYQYQALRSNNFFQSNWHANKLTVVESLIKKYHPETILDLGAGSGNLELAFASKVKQITAVDYNDEAVDFLKKKIKTHKIKNVVVKQSDLSETKLIQSLGKFDLIIMVDVLEHLELGVSSKLIGTFKKILNQKGKIVIITPNYQSLWPYLERFVDRFTNIPDLEHCQHISKFTTDNITDPFENKGFICEYLGTFNTFSFLLPHRKIADALTKAEMSLPIKWGNLLIAVFSK